MKNVLVTGAGGFIGSHLTELLVKKGLNVKAFVHYNSNNSWGWLDSSKIKGDIEVISGDIRDFDSVYNSAKDVDTVFHLAALMDIRYSYLSPLVFIITNVEGTSNVLTSARMSAIRNTIIISTSELYGTAYLFPLY